MTNKDIKIATIREALWIKVRDAAISRIQNAKDNMEIDTEILKRAEEIIKEENAS